MKVPAPLNSLSAPSCLRESTGLKRKEARKDEGFRIKTKEWKEGERMERTNVFKNTNWSHEGEVGCTERMKIQFPP